ncbi:hypothetical protein [Microbacterium sp. zg.Y909]|uniref:hypothetical protein n=1 Tax=Microbacterium sp. zg.Y909 TaxID=2969413 RepID=UPI00214CC156|nr:hypothetical protein [Microbacterium sp. zg.Y909]MCR2827856.1 hypothetical protein [Microbacterium sp. zg.Y909]
MPQQPAPLPPTLGQFFSAAEARALGVSPGRLRAADLESPFRGARVVRAPDATGDADHPATGTAEREQARREHLLARARAFVTVMPPYAFFTGITAAAIWGAPLPRSSARNPGGEPLDVAVFAPDRPLRTSGVRGYQTTPSLTAVVRHRGLPVACPASTWASLGRVFSVSQLVVVGDAMVHQHRRRNGDRGGVTAPLATLDDLAAAAAGRRVGVARLRQALPHIRVGSMSPGETDLRLALTAGGLPEPALDFDLADAAGRRFGWTEIAYPRWRVLVEYEGDHHRTDRAQWHRDIAKHARCRDLGWDVVRVTSADLYPRPLAAVARVRQALARAGWRP